MALAQTEYRPALDHQKSYQKAKERFQNDPNVSAQNKELVLRFLRDTRIGKTVSGRAKKKIGECTLRGFIIALQYFISVTKKDLDKVEDAEMERFIELLEDNQLPPNPNIRNLQRRISGGLSSRYRLDIKLVIKKFYRWHYQTLDQDPPLVSWFDTSKKEAEINALTPLEVQRMIDLHATSTNALSYSFSSTAARDTANS